MRKLLVVLVVSLLGVNLSTAQEETFKVRRYTIGGGLFHGMGGAELIVNETSITFTNKLVPEFNNKWLLDDSLELVFRDSRGWKYQTSETKLNDGFYNGTRIMFIEGKKPTLTIEMKDSFTGKVHTYTFLLIRKK